MASFFWVRGAERSCFHLWPSAALLNGPNASLAHSQHSIPASLKLITHLPNFHLESSLLQIFHHRLEMWRADTFQGEQWKDPHFPRYAQQLADRGLMKLPIEMTRIQKQEMG